MKQLLIVLTVALAACAAAGNGGPLEVRIAATGTNAIAELSQPQAMAARDAETLQRLWATEIGGGAPPSVDFAKETVVFLFAGTRNTGGWSITEPTAQIENGILVVDAKVQGPPPAAMVTQALTSPYVVLVVGTKKFDDLLWRR